MLSIWQHRIIEILQLNLTYSRSRHIVILIRFLLALHGPNSMLLHLLPQIVLKIVLSLWRIELVFGARAACARKLIFRGLENRVVSVCERPTSFADERSNNASEYYLLTHVPRNVKLPFDPSHQGFPLFSLFILAKPAWTNLLLQSLEESDFQLRRFF